MPRRRSRHEMEYELIDTGVFDEDRYFDVFVEYALAEPEDILIRITVANQGPEDARVHVLPHLWFRNTWSWPEGSPRPELKQVAGPAGFQVIGAIHPQLGERFLACEIEPMLLFTENETDLNESSAPPTAPHMSRTGSTTTWCTVKLKPSIPR